MEFIATTLAGKRADGGQSPVSARFQSAPMTPVRAPPNSARSTTGRASGPVDFDRLESLIEGAKRANDEKDDVRREGFALRARKLAQALAHGFGSLATLADLTVKVSEEAVASATARQRTGQRLKGVVAEVRRLFEGARMEMVSLILEEHQAQDVGARRPRKATRAKSRSPPPAPPSFVQLPCRRGVRPEWRPIAPMTASFQGGARGGRRQSEGLSPSGKTGTSSERRKTDSTLLPPHE